MAKQFCSDYIMINKARLLTILVSSFILPSYVFALTTKITSIEIPRNLANTQIMIKSSAPIQPHVFALANPERLVCDFPNTQLSVNLKSVNTFRTAVKSIRSGAPIPRVLRLVFDINTPFNFKVTSKIPTQQLLINIALPVKKTEAMKTVEKNQTNIVKTNAIKHVVITKIETPAPPESRVLTVMIDPGHGGKDTGAIGPSGIREKDVVLRISLQLADLINRNPQMRAVLTRNGDYFVTLHNRLVLARKNKADIYVSIHADSFMNDWARGASVYALSKNGATSIAARWLARRDNYSELGNVPLNHLEDQSPILRSVLIDLAQTVTVTDSMRLGSSLLDEMDNVTMLHYPRVEQAPFMVLKSPDIPSVLVETGFISNPREELKLRDARYQQKMALSLFNGIRNYQKKYAIAGV